MIAAVERLLSIRVVDAMSRDVVSISTNSTMAEAAEIFLRHHISGAPVVDEFGHCVGILSATDLMKAEYSQSGDGTTSPAGEEFQLVGDDGVAPFHVEHVAKDYVVHHMSCAPQTIDFEQSLIDAARYMQGGHLHRLIVLDEHAHPLGVVSSLDIVSALVKTVDEHAAISSPKR
ncbi:MAG: CBS domain-containing protein [Bythopirellula sp.]